MISINQQKYITSLHLKKFRQKYRNFLVEGEKMVKELLTQQRTAVVSIYGTERWATQNAALLQPFYDKFNTTTEVELKKIGTLTTPNQVLAVATIPEQAILSTIDPHLMTLYLDGIQDPGNMGTILRIADWFGIKAVCCSEDTVDAFSPKVVQSGMGACFRVPVWEGIVLSDLVKTHPVTSVIGAVMDGQNLFSSALPSQGILVIGNEGKGIRAENEKLLTHKITIPRGAENGAESLNAGVATGILVAELLQNKLVH
jgi:RNA methyltransferase, TrmH family